MADYGTFLSLSGRKDWNVVRADRQNALLYQKQMNADLQERIQREAQSRAGVQEYMAQLNQASVLEGDLERVKGVEAEQRKKIVEGLKKAGGDYNKFLLGEGSGILNNYYQNVMQSKEMQGAINNKLTFAQGSLDTYMGRKQRPTEVTLQDGTKKQVTFEEQLQMFDNGEIDTLNYNGSVIPTDPIKVYDYISKTYGKDKFTRQEANTEDIVNYAKAMGAEDWEAQQIADNYDQEIGAGGTPVYFKNEEQEIDWNQLIAKEKYMKMLSGEDEEGTTGNVDIIGDLFIGDLASPSFAGNPLEYKVDMDGIKGVASVKEAKNLGSKLLNGMVELEGFVVDEKTGALKIQGEGTKDIYYVPKEGKDAPIVKGKLKGEDTIYEPESFVRMQVSVNGKEETRTFIKAKASIESNKSLPSGDYGQSNRSTNLGTFVRGEDNQATILIPVTYDAKKYALLNDEYSVSSKQQSVSGASADIDVWAKQNAKKAVTQGGDYTIFGANGANVQDPQYAKYAEQIKADPRGYEQKMSQINLGDLVTQAAQNNGVSAQELNALFTIESNYNPIAVSSAGAMGIGQLMPATAKGLGVENPFDPAENINASAEMFAGLRKRYSSYKDPMLAVAAYNWGSGNVSKSVKKFGENWVEGANKGFFDDEGDWVKMPEETNNYMAKFGAALGY